MKCTVLVDNRANPSAGTLRSEHGLSLLIEVGGKAVLFDSGASDLFSRNSKELGVDLRAVDAFVLSHGHYDHGGGLATFLALNDRAKVYCGPGALEKHFVKVLGFISKDIGLERDTFEAYRTRFVFVDGTTEILPGVYAVSRIPMAHAVPRDMRTFLAKTKTQMGNDDFSHEMILVAKESDGISVFTGCAHKGVLNILDAAQSGFPGQRIKVVVGGLHMMNPMTKKLGLPEEEIRAIGLGLKDKGTLSTLYAGHCTGEEAYSLLRQEMGELIQPLEVGKQFEA